MIVLASASPRRRELLSLLGVPFRVCPTNVNEDPLPGELPLDTQHRITREKANAARQRLEIEDCTAAHEESLNSGLPSVIIACDTTVLLDGEMLNKPANAVEARDMLRRLRGRAHEVQSCIVIEQSQQETVDIVSSLVVMREYSDEEIETYVASGDPFDKAGSYAVQHEIFQPVATIRGCPLNVVGLALCHLQAHLPDLPCPAPVCVALFDKPCPEKLDDPFHSVAGRRSEGRGSKG